MKTSAFFSASTTAGSAGTDMDAYTYLRGVWNDHLQPTHIRMRAAAIGIEFERPRMAVTAVVGEQDFATLLDQRLKKIEEMKLIEQSTTGSTDVRLPPGVSDRRFRRV